MLTAIKAYYDGEQIVVDDQDRKNLNSGDHLIITILSETDAPHSEALAAKRRHLIDEKKYVRPTGRSAEEIDRYIKELRDEDRI